MSEFLESLSGLEWLFFVSATLGGILFLVRLTLQFIGGGDADMDTDAGGDLGGHGHTHHGDSDTSFKILTLQGVTGFFMIFGLTGLAFMRGTPVGPLISSAIAFLAGYATLWVLGWLMAVMLSLQSSGNVDLRNAIGQEATVYLRIPAHGTGQAQVCVQNRLRILDAVAEDRGEIASGEQVRIVDVIDGHLAVVKKV